MPHQINCCRICGNKNLVSVLHLGEQYLTGVFPRNSEEAITSGPLELVKCVGDSFCGLLQLHHSYDSSEMYGSNYGYRSSLNASMVEHLKAKVADLSERVRLDRGDLVLDIGSNDGTLLSFYPASNQTVVGIDPTASKFRHFYQPHIEVIEDFFSSETFKNHYGARKAKIITSIAMFYDLEVPISFVEQIGEILDVDGVWHFEQSYMPAMLAQNAYDTVCHEHLEYYGLRQIKWMTDRCGLKIIDVELNEINGGSFAVTVAKVESKYSEKTEGIERLLAAEDAAGLATLRPFEEFRCRVFRHRDQLNELLLGLERKGAKVFGYGASTKGNVILQFCGITSERLPFIAEVNQEKFGAVTPGTHIPIISEVEAHAMSPDYLLVMPWHFKGNLLRREAEFLACGGKMIFPLPEIAIAGA